MINIEKLIKEMSIKEKIGQLNLISYNNNMIDQIRSGEIGAVINAYGYDVIYKLQEAALKSPHKIPLLIGDDVIHGYRTIFPVPIGEASSFNLDLMEETAYLSMLEARKEGYNWIYAPMIDITNDPRWGRIMETSGEDPYLTSMIAKSRVRGIQRPYNQQVTAACCKHFLGYGGVEAGLDYSTSDFSEYKMRKYYLPPFKAAIDEGVFSVMHSFTTYNHEPVTSSRFVLRKILREECGFAGVLVTDWACLELIIKYQIAMNEYEAAKIGLDVGIDIDMHGKVYINELENLITNNPVYMESLNEAVRRVLIMKEKMGLFSNPFAYLNEDNFDARIRKHAKKSSDESIILFKNKDNLLPLNPKTRMLVIGSFNHDKDIHLGAWSCKGKSENVVSLSEGLIEKFENIDFFNTPTDINLTDFTQLGSIIKKYEVLVLALGEPRSYSGENNCRVSINLPYNQDKLVDFVFSLGKPTVGLVMAGRPLAISNLNNKADAIIWCYHLGSEAGTSIADVFVGDVIPSAKTTVTFPKELGQVPIYYNRLKYGRMEMVHYVDGDIEPLYPFGFGLSYAKFIYHDFKLNYENKTLSLEVKIENQSIYDAWEIIQVYLISKNNYYLNPQKELIGFKKVFISKCQILDVNFDLLIDCSNYRDEVIIQVGSSSKEGIQKTLKL